MYPLLKTRESLLLLGEASRRFLVFSCANSVSWQVLTGSVLILHARALSLPPGSVGAVMSLTPFTMVLSLFVGPLSERLGPRRLMSIGWSLRYIGALPLVLTPWVYTRWGNGAAGAALFTGVLCFCVIRSLTCVGWFPWLQEIVPETERGRYFSIEMLLVQAVNITIGLGVCLFLGNDAVLWKFGVVSALGLVVGFASIGLMLRIPGGRPHPSPPRRHAAVDVRLVLRDDAFMRYALWTSVGVFATIGQSTLIILQMRDFLLISPADIMLATAIGGGAAMCAGIWWGRLSDRHGSAPVQLLSGLVLALGLVAFAGLRAGPQARLLAIPLFAVCMMGYCGFFVASNRGMLFRMRPRLRATYSGVWLSLTSLAAGISNVLLGVILERAGPRGYWGMCIAYAVVLSIAALRCGSLPEKGTDMKAQLRLLVLPSRPLFSLMRMSGYILNPPAKEEITKVEPTRSKEGGYR